MEPWPLRVQRDPDNQRVFLHFGDAEHHPMQTLGFPLTDDDHLIAEDFEEAVYFANLLGTSATSTDTGAKVRLPKEE